MDGLPSGNGAFGFLKPLLWAAAGDTSWSCQGLNVLFVIKKTQAVFIPGHFSAKST